MRRGKQSRSRLGWALLLALVTLAVAPALVARAGDDDGNRAQEKFAAYEAEIQAAVKAGKLTEEQAEKKLEAYRKKLLRGDHHGENKKPKEIYREVKAEIQAAVKAGKLTEEEAEKKLAALKKKLFGGDEDWGEKGSPKDYYLAAERKIRAAVEAGKLTEEQAEKKLAALKKKLWGDDDDDHHREEKDWRGDEKEDPAYRMDRLLRERWEELEKQKAMIGEKLKKTFAMLERRGVSPGDIEKKMNAAEAEAKRALQRGFQAIEEAKEMLERGAPQHEVMRRLKGEGRNDRNWGPERFGRDGRRSGDSRERYLAEARRRLRDNQNMDPEEMEHHMARLREELDRSRAWGRGRPGDRRGDRRGEEDDRDRLPGMGFMDELEERLDEFEESGDDQFEELDERFEELDHEFDEWDERFQELDERFEDLERGFGRGLERLREAMEQQARHMEELHERFGHELEKMNERYGYEFEKLHERFGHEIEKLHERYGHEIEKLHERLEALENDSNDR